MRAAEREGVAIAEIRLVPWIPRTPVSQELRDAAEAIMNQPFPSFDPDGATEVIDLPRLAVFIFHAVAAPNPDGTFTITIPGLPGPEVTVTDPEDGPDALARVIEREWDREPDTIIVAVHTDAETDAPSRGQTT
ncbi:hypothetical protein [Phytomonospora endophytica]|uniref:Uncharacterized protein n=1 Tax=Phytomonospora endophytica TaxID=714109 RepID=A0A841FNQ7_9ACTN|nr:hypothetical protein [Phytomonospora endophytica]MBB6037736.1 hypothetical protein [Phytomonospora endophytica]